MKRMKPFVATAAAAVLCATTMLSAQSPLKVGNLTFEPATEVELDFGKLKGVPARLAWSPDAKLIYLQTVEGDYGTPKATHHYMIEIESRRTRNLQALPEWFSPYWSIKSHKSSPDVTGLDIELKSEQSRAQTTSAPLGGDLARGGTVTGVGASSDDAISAAYNSQMVTTHTMKLKGETIGQFVNSVIVPGLTFAWAPKGYQAIAFTQPKKGNVLVMNAEGVKQEVKGSDDAILPAWSHDATMLAWLQKDGKKKYDLKIVHVK